MTVIGGTKRVPLTEGLLNLIIMIQDYKRLIISQSQYTEFHHNKKTDWYRETEDFFNNLDSDVLEQYNLSKNIISFEKVIHFKVTDEMRSTLYADLPKKFTF